MAGEREKPEQRDRNHQELIAYFRNPVRGCCGPDAGADVPVSDANRLPDRTPQAKDLDPQHTDRERPGDKGGKPGSSLLEREASINPPDSSDHNHGVERHEQQRHSRVKSPVALSAGHTDLVRVTA